jgi:large subunit ribosomal protein LP2
MKLVAAYLLVALSGKNPDEKSILDVLSSVGIEGDKAQIAKLLAELNGKDVHALIEQGKGKLATVNLGGGGGGGGAAPAEEKKDAGKKDDAKKDAGKKEAPKKKEEPKEEPKEEEGDFGFGLFD